MAFHPAGIVCLWLCWVIGIQFAGFFLCFLLLFFLFSTVNPFIFLKKWSSLLKRNVFLFLSLWLILAYQTPGDLYFNLSFLPTEQGILLAWLQTLRLAVMLATLIWLNHLLNQTQFCLALWTLFKPLERLHIPVERFIVRLSIVLKNLENPPALSFQAWQEWLNQVPDNAPSTLNMAQTKWQKHDCWLFLPALLWMVCLL